MLLKEEELSTVNAKRKNKKARKSAVTEKMSTAVSLREEAFFSRPWFAALSTVRFEPGHAWCRTPRSRVGRI